LKTVTLRDVAHEAGVSHTVVSSVLRGDRSSNVRVSEATRKRVEEVAGRMRYRPNIAARGLREQRSFLVGLVLREVNLQIAGPLIQGLGAALAEHDYAAAVSVYSDGLFGESREVYRCIERRVDGLIVNAAPSVGEGGGRAWLEGVGRPVVELFGKSLPGVPSLEIDFEADGAAATQHLWQQGHRRIGLLIHDRHVGGGHPTAERFARGYRAAMAAVGADPVVFVHSLASDSAWEEQFVAGAEGLLSRVLSHPGGITGLVCYSDYHAYGILRAARKAGVRIPEDLSIVGHYDLEISRVVSPSVTSLKIAAERIGACAGRMIVDAIDGKAPGSMLLQSALMERESTSSLV
jgi:LacI family transcriptional regulator